MEGQDVKKNITPFLNVKKPHVHDEHEASRRCQSLNGLYAIVLISA